MDNYDCDKCDRKVTCDRCDKKICICTQENHDYDRKPHKFEGYYLVYDKPVCPTCYKSYT